MKHFLSVTDAGDINRLVEKAIMMKRNPGGTRTGVGKRLGLIFMNPSLRTRVSSQVAAMNLGMDVIVLNTGTDGWQLEFGDQTIMNGKTAEHVREAAAVMGQYFDILGIRTFPALQDKDYDYSEVVLNAFVQYSGRPVISLESATRHPLQSLADAITIYEQRVLLKKVRPKVVLMWAPHIKSLPQSVPNSFAEWMGAWSEVDFSISHPKGYELDKKFSGGTPVVYDQDQALEGADFIYVKNWSSVTAYGQILPVDKNWMLTKQRLKATNNARVMHCLPVRRNLVISDDILDSPSSIVIEQAGNRVWSAQAVLREILGGLSGAERSSGNE